MTRIDGELATLLSALGLPQGDTRLLDAIVLVGPPGEQDRFVRDDGVTAEYLVVRETGAELRFVDGALGSVLLRTQPEPGYGTYPRPGALIVGLSATATRAEVRSALGEPEAERAGWDRFEVDGGFVHCRYLDDRIARISVMRDVPR